MPLLYGEGHKAFIRLQHEIIRQSADDSIFAWKINRELSGSSDREQNSTANRRHACLDNCSVGSILATRPDAFRLSGSIVSSKNNKTDTSIAVAQCRLPYSITNYGLQLTTDCEVTPRDATDSRRDVYLIQLDCFEQTARNVLRPCWIAIAQVRELAGRPLNPAKEHLVMHERVHYCDLGEKLEGFYPLRQRERLEGACLYVPIR